MSTSSSEAAAELVEHVKAVHRAFPTGVTIVTTLVDGQPYGLAVNAFSSVSLDPPAVLACVARSSLTHDHLLRGEHIAVNVLAHDQDELAQAFARSGGDKFAGLAWHRGPHGQPLLDGAAAHLELAIEQRLPAYTHTIFIGRVVAAGASGEAPLVYLGGQLLDGAQLHRA